MLLRFLSLTDSPNFFTILMMKMKGGTERIKEKAVQNGTYVVKIYATDLFGKVFKQTKTIHLIR